MRIAWVIYGSMEQATGGYVYDRMIVEALRRRGVGAAVISIEPGCDVALLLDDLRNRGVDSVVGDALCIPEIGPLFERMGPAIRRVLLVHHLTSWELEIEDRTSWLPLEARALVASDVVITTSETTARSLGVAASVVVPGADRLPVEPRPARGEDIVVLGVGSLIPRKRWTWVLDAMDHLRDPHLFLRLAGDDARDHAYTHSIGEAIARSPYLRDHVRHLGVVDDEALAHEYARADVLVLPSSLEGYGMVLAEALYAGLPVFGARSDAIVEATGGGHGAFFFDDPRELTEALARLSRDGRWRRQLQEEAGSRAAHLPTWSEAAARFEAVLAR